KHGEMVVLYLNYTNHPIESINFGKKFCKDNGIKCSVETNPTKLDVRLREDCFSESDRIQIESLAQCRAQYLEPGKDCGMISYNETPMKKFIYKGITVISTDFKTMGEMAAEFVANDKPMDICIPTQVFVRDSL